MICKETSDKQKRNHKQYKTDQLGLLFGCQSPSWCFSARACCTLGQYANLLYGCSLHMGLPTTDSTLAVGLKGVGVRLWIDPTRAG